MVELAKTPGKSCDDEDRLMLVFGGGDLCSLVEAAELERRTVAVCCTSGELECRDVGEMACSRVGETPRYTLMTEDATAPKDCARL